MPEAAFDGLVVGAGPAGLSCAIALAMRGMRVRVVDAERQAPLDKACGEGILPDALECLKRLGVQGMVGHRLAGIRFRMGTLAAEARFPATEGLGVRRTELHRAMLKRAEDLGVIVEWKSAFPNLGGAAARLVVGADGGKSRVRSLAGLDVRGKVTTRRIGLRQHFGVAPWSDFVEVYWGDGAQAYVTPVGAGEIGVAFLSKRKFAGVEQALCSFPELRDRLHGAATTSLPRGALSVTRFLSRVTTGCIALAGDASGAVDAITGEGLSLCFRQAEALADAFATGDLEAYEGAHRQIMRMPRVMSRALLWMDRSALVRRGAITLLSQFPQVFEGLLKVHVESDRKVARFAASGVIREV